MNELTRLRPATVHQTSRRTGFWTWLVLGSATAVSLYAVLGYTLLPLGVLVHPEMRAAFQLERLPLYTHVFSSAAALAIGPLQFVPALRRRRAVHRRLGRAYLVAVVLGGVSGLNLAFFATGGPWVRAGFLTLAIAWLFTAGQGLRSIRAGRVDAHRRWMLRNYALTFAAVTLRLQVGVVSFVVGVPFLDFYPVVAWSCWVPNLIVAQWLMRRR